MERRKTDSNPSLGTIAFIATICFFILSAVPTIAQDKSGAPKKLIVGTMILPPFVMKAPSGEWEGLSIELLQAVTLDLGIDYELREYNSTDYLKDAVVNEELDLIPVIGVTGKYELILDFSNSYYRSGAAIAVKTEGNMHGWSRVVELFFSIHFFKLICLLVLLWIVTGAFVWFLESRRNNEMFGDRIIKGLGHGIWWAAVTMTTVGYGDKTPKTFGGRVVAIFWMFASIILISSFTAAITTSLTIGDLRGNVRGFHDLPNVRVGSLAHSEPLKYVTENGITVMPFRNIQDGLQALAENKLDAFIADKIILKHLVKTEYPAHLHVLAATFDHYFISMAMPQGSSLREPLNMALLRAIKNEKWDMLVKQYLGSAN
jgi:ABC-type amino acid transport substrate-binding protein